MSIWYPSWIPDFNFYTIGVKIMAKIKSKLHLGGYNLVPEVKDQWSLPERVYVVDETLREGEETPGAIMSIDNKLKIAKFLEKMGVHETNVGFVCSIEDHAEISRRINKECTKLIGSAYIRVYGEKGDFKDRVKYAMDTGVERIAVLAPVSEHIFRSRKELNLNKGKVFEDIILSVQKAKECGVKITCAPYDDTRTDLDYLKTILKTAVEEGADRALVYDTLGVQSPQATFYWMRELKKALTVPIEYHCHNDFGLAVANTCAAVTAGAEYIDLVINGIGDRAGNASFEETVLALESLYEVNTGIDMHSLYDACKLVESITQIPIPNTKAVCGRNAFIQESDVHVSALLSGHSDAFEPYDPSIVGQQRAIWFGSTTSSYSLEILAKSMNIELSKSQKKDLMKKIVVKVDKEGHATQQEVEAFISEVK